MTCSQQGCRRMSPHKLALLLIFSWMATLGCDYEFPLKEDENGGRPTPPNIEEDESEFETSSDADPDNSSDSESQSTSSSFSTENDTDNDTLTIPDLPSCPGEIAFHSSATLTGLAGGKTPGTQYLDTCPKGQVIVGFHGFLMDFTTALVHGRLQAICGSLSLSAIGKQCIVETKTEYTLPLRGSNGDIEWTRTCPANEMVIGFGAKTGVDVDQLTFHCAPLSVSNDGDRYSVARGFSTELPLVGGSGGGTTIGLISCPDNTVARATNIYSANIVTAFGLECQPASPN